MNKLSIFIALILVAATITAEQTKTILSPYTGKLDFITKLSSSTLPSGSTFYIQDTGVGGLFTVNGSSPSVATNGEISVSNAGAPAAWVWIGGNRYRFTLTLDSIANQYLVLEDGSFALLEDNTKWVLE